MSEIRQSLSAERRESEEDKVLERAAAFFIQDDEAISAVVRHFFPARLPTPAAEAPGETHAASRRSPGSGGDGLGYETNRGVFRNLLQTFFSAGGSFTLVRERYHVDPAYRDSYYNYFAGQHFDMSRFSTRLTFFRGNWCKDDTFSFQNRKELNDCFMGTCVIYPTEAHTLGRVLIRPEYIVKKGAPSYLRLTGYTITVFGIRIVFDAFPFQMQDRETTRCAEVTLLNLLDYFGNTYSDYRTYLPSEIIRLEQEFNPDRTLPSRGINYFTMSRLLTKCGFAPRLYGKAALQGDRAHKRRDMQRLLHYYIESGIPVAVNVANPDDLSSPGHSLICIGYVGKTARSGSRPEADDIGDGFKLVNAADYFDEYIVIDDNQMPYASRSFDHLSIHEHLSVEYILIPLYKRMYLEAADAYSVVSSVLRHEDYGLKKRYPAISSEEAVVVRLFLASSRTFKMFRIEHSEDQDIAYRNLYGSIPLPRFVWIAELFAARDFEAPSGKAFGEIVLDATSATKNDIKSVIMLNYPNTVSVRWPNSTIRALNKGYKYPTFALKPFPRFTGNLSIIDK